MDSYQFIETWGLIVFAYFWLVLIANIALVIFGTLSARPVARRVTLSGDSLGKSPLTPRISILIPAYNEQAGIVTSVWSLIANRYPRREIIVIDDGSTDDTLVELHKAFDLIDLPVPEHYEINTEPITRLMRSRIHPDVLVASKINGGRSDAVNVGINLARGELILMIDADTILHPEALARASRPFIEDPVRCLGVGGQVRVLNGVNFKAGVVTGGRHKGRTVVVCMQILEYVRSFLGGRMAWSRLNALMIVSGAFSLYRRDILLRLGGLDSATIGEDMEIVLRIQEQVRPQIPGSYLEFVPDAICWTEVPSRIGDLRGQRIRWHVGLLQNMIRYMHLLMRGPDRKGLKAGMMFMLLVEVLGPLVEFFGLLLLPIVVFYTPVTMGMITLLVLLAVLTGLLLSITSLLVDQTSSEHALDHREISLLILLGLVEVLWYRPLNAWWRVRATARFMRKASHSWGEIARGAATRQDTALHASQQPRLTPAAQVEATGASLREG